VSELNVIARNSSFTYKGKPVDVKRVGRELGVRYVLEGSVRKAGNRVRVTGQLIDAESGAHIWADRFDRDLTDIFAVQDELTHEIIAALKIKLSAAEKALIADSGTKNVSAHDFFLKGRELMFGSKRDRDIFEQFMSCFRRAIELDPNYASAYAGLGMGYAFDYQNHWSDAPEKSLDQAQRLVDEAIAKDDKDAFARFVAAVVATWKKDYERWALESDKALGLNPNYALALLTRGNVHIYTGEPTKAIPYIERAMRLDPPTGPNTVNTCISSALLISWQANTRPRRPASRIASRSIRPRTCLALSSRQRWAIWVATRNLGRCGTSLRRSILDTLTRIILLDCRLETPLMPIS